MRIGKYTREEIERITFDSYVKVSLAKVIKDFLNSEASAFILPQVNILSQEETQLLEIIHSGEYESLTINFKNKKMKSLQMVKEQDVKKRVVDVLSENAYQDIVIKTHKGIVTKIQNTVKVNFS